MPFQEYHTHDASEFGESNNATNPNNTRVKVFHFSNERERIVMCLLIQGAQIWNPKLSDWDVVLSKVGGVWRNGRCSVHAQHQVERQAAGTR